MVKNLPANVGDSGDTGLIPESGRSPGGGNSNSIQYSCLENSMGREAWWATVHGVTKSWTLLKRLSMRTCLTNYPRTSWLKSTMFMISEDSEGQELGQSMVATAQSVPCDVCQEQKEAIIFFACLAPWPGRLGLAWLGSSLCPLHVAFPWHPSSRGARYCMWT